MYIGKTFQRWCSFDAVYSGHWAYCGEEKVILENVLCIYVYMFKYISIFLSPFFSVSITSRQKY